jgi:hypothetical protein
MQSPSTSDNQGGTVDSTRRYTPRDTSQSGWRKLGQDSTSKDANTSTSRVSGAANGTTPNPTGDGNNPGHNPDSSRPEKQSSSTTGQQANAPNRTENRDNATTKSTTP